MLSRGNRADRCCRCSPFATMDPMCTAAFRRERLARPLGGPESTSAHPLPRLRGFSNPRDERTEEATASHARTAATSAASAEEKRAATLLEAPLRPSYDCRRRPLLLPRSAASPLLAAGLSSRCNPVTSEPEGRGRGEQPSPLLHLRRLRCDDTACAQLVCAQLIVCAMTACMILSWLSLSFHHAPSVFFLPPASFSRVRRLQLCFVASLNPSLTIRRPAATCPSSIAARSHGAFTTPQGQSHCGCRFERNKGQEKEATADRTFSACFRMDHWMCSGWLSALSCSYCCSN
jgi:hypothetical protein